MADRELTPDERLSEVTRLLAEGARLLLEKRRAQTPTTEADQAAADKAEASSRS
jgi:hypothetical protein